MVSVVVVVVVLVAKTAYCLLLHRHESWGG